jgi:transposase InsO family protein
MFDSQPRPVMLLDRSAPPVRPEAYRPAEPEDKPPDRTSRQGHSCTVQSVSRPGHSVKCVRGRAQRADGNRPPDRTRDAMDTAPLHFRSHGFCDALLYNRERPHSSLHNLTPEEFAAKHQINSTVARTAWPAPDQELAGAVQRAPASEPEPKRFSATLRSR